jgi:hypothetical protein
VSVRNRAVAELCRAIDGALSFNAITDTAIIGPLDGPRRVMNIDAYEQRYGAVYEHVVKKIDWNRVILEASGRHLRVGHEDRDNGLADLICGECIEAALLAEETFPDWEDDRG